MLISSLVPLSSSDAFVAATALADSSPRFHGRTGGAGEPRWTGGDEMRTGQWAVARRRGGGGATVLLPLRVMVAVLLLRAYYRVCGVCTLGVEEEREGEGYATTAHSRVPCSSSLGSTGSARTTAYSQCRRSNFESW